MKCQLFVRPEAEEDISGAFRWYEDRVRGLGKDFLRCIEASFTKIQRAPAANPIIYKDVRRMLTRRFPFGVFYIISNQKIVVLAVLHARRAPKARNI